MQLQTVIITLLQLLITTATRADPGWYEQCASKCTTSPSECSTCCAEAGLRAGFEPFGAQCVQNNTCICLEQSSGHRYKRDWQDQAIDWAARQRCGAWCHSGFDGQHRCWAWGACYTADGYSGSRVCPNGFACHCYGNNPVCEWTRHSNGRRKREIPNETGNSSTSLSREKRSCHSSCKNQGCKGGRCFKVEGREVPDAPCCDTGYIWRCVECRG